MPHEAGAGEAERFALHLGVVGQHGVVGGALLERLEQALAGGAARGIDAVGRREPGGAGLGVNEINVAVFRPQETGTATDAGIANEQISGQLAAHRAAFVGDDRTHRRINRAAAHRTARVDVVGGERVLDAELVIHGAHGGHVLG